MIVRLLFVLRRRWPVLLALAVAGAGAGYLIGPRSGPSTDRPTYQATALVSANQSAANPTSIQQDLVEANHGAVAQAVARDLGGGVTPDQVAARVSGSFDVETYVATVTARATDPAEANRWARSFAEAFVTAGNGGATDAQRAELDQAQADRDGAEAALRTFLADNAEALAAPGTPALLANEQATLQDAADAAQAKVAGLEAAQRPTDVYELIDVGAGRAVAPGKLQVLEDPLLRAVLGLALGLALAAAVVAVAERTNPRIDDPEQAAEAVGAPVLAMVPRLSRGRRSMIERVDPERFRGPYAEAFRTLRSHLEFRAAAEQRQAPPRIMVTSATPSEGKTTTTAFLALSFAESTTSPVVIGGDLRRPTIHRLFGLDRVPGLTSRSLPGGSRIPLTSIVRRDPVSGVTVVPSGPSVDHVNDVQRDLVAVAEVAQASGQVVLLDTAPVRVANDAVDFLAAVDWVVVVVHAGRSSRRAVTQMLHSLRMNGAEVAGVVMVGSAEAADASRDYYNYYAPEARRRRPPRAERPEPVADLTEPVAPHQPPVTVGVG